MYQVMLIDDEPWTLIYLNKLFSRPDLGFTVSASQSDASGALSAILSNPPDVIVTDIQMPGLTGLKLLETIHQNHLQCLTVILSAYAEYDYAKQALKFGAFDYLVKPVNMQDVQNLLIQIRQHLEKSPHSEDNLSQDESPSDSSAFEFEKLLAYIKKHYREKLLIKDLAKQFFLSPNYCSSTFVQRTGMTFSRYLTHLRMEKAVELLNAGSWSIQEIANFTGYDDLVYFTKVFKKHYGIPPAQYRKQIQKTEVPT